jgi:hypothetical protein
MHCPVPLRNGNLVLQKIYVAMTIYTETAIDGFFCGVIDLNAEVNLKLRLLTWDH